MSREGGGSRILLWGRRLVPAVLGAGILYLTWRVVTENSAPVEIDFLLVTVELAVWEAVLGSFVAGALLVGLFTLYQMARGGLVSRRYRRRLADLEMEVHQLRNLPLDPQVDAEHRLAGPQALSEGEPEAESEVEVLASGAGSSEGAKS